MTAGLAACGGGGGAAPAPGASPVPGQPMPTIDASPPPSATQAARFLTQATLGASKADIAAVQSSGYAAWLDGQFNMPATEGHVAWLMANGFNVEANRHNTAGLNNIIWRKLVGSPDVLRQRMVLALSEICVVSLLGINSEWRQFVVAAYMDVLEANAFGNYRTLLQQISTSPAKGFYLTFRGSEKPTPTPAASRMKTMRVS